MNGVSEVTFRNYDEATGFYFDDTVEANVYGNDLVMSSGYWVVDESLNIGDASGEEESHNIFISGDVKLILADDANLTMRWNDVSTMDSAEKASSIGGTVSDILTVTEDASDLGTLIGGISDSASKLIENDDTVGTDVAMVSVADGSSLTIYGQKGGTGKLDVEAPTAPSASNGAGAAIGGDSKCSNGAITINGGQVIAVTAHQAAAIGGGSNAMGHNITINGGYVNAQTTDDKAAAIGGGKNGAGVDITINGGHVEASASEYGAGIGGGKYKNGSNITINGGRVVASANKGGAGIGGGYDAASPDNTHDITISNGSVTAYGSQAVDSGAPGIGSGASISNNVTASYFTVSGGNVSASGGSMAMGSGVAGLAYSIYFSGVSLSLDGEPQGYQDGSYDWASDEDFNDAKALTSSSEQVTENPTDLTGSNTSTAGYYENTMLGGLFRVTEGNLLANTETATITGLNNNGDQIYGGAIYTDGGSLNLYSITISDNKSLSNGVQGSGAAVGGAIYASGETGSTAVNLGTFENNVTTGSSGDFRGGAIASEQDALSVRKSTFSANKTTGKGGAIWANGNSVSIANSEFTGNYAGKGGAIYAAGTQTIAGDTFTGNVGGSAGGAVYAADGSQVTIKGSTFEGNASHTYNYDPTDSAQADLGDHRGGALYVAGDVTVEASTFTGNYAKEGSAAYVEESGVLTLDGVSFSDSHSVVTDDDGNTITEFCAVHNAGTVNLAGRVTFNSDDKIYNEGRINWDTTGATANGYLTDLTRVINAKGEGTLGITVNANDIGGASRYVLGANADFTILPESLTKFVLSGVEGQTDTDISLNGDAVEYNGKLYKLTSSDSAADGYEFVLTVTEKDGTPSRTEHIVVSKANYADGILNVAGDFTSFGSGEAEGGIVQVAADGTFSAHDASFSSARAQKGGAIYAKAGSKVNLTNVLFNANASVGGQSGALYIEKGATTTLYGDVTLASNGDTIYNAGELVWNIGYASAGYLSDYARLTNAGTLAITVEGAAANGNYKLADNALTAIGETFTLTDSDGNAMTLTVNGAGQTRDGYAWNLSVDETDPSAALYLSVTADRVVVEDGASKALTVGYTIDMTGSEAYEGSGQILEVKEGGTLTVAEGSKFVGASATENGGVLSNDGTATLTGVTFAGNSAANGGAIAMGDGDLNLADVVFDGNMATGQGGAISVSGNGSVNLYGSVTLATDSDTIDLGTNGKLMFNLSATDGSGYLSDFSKVTGVQNETITVKVNYSDATDALYVLADNAGNLSNVVCTIFVPGSTEGVYETKEITVNGNAASSGDYYYSLKINEEEQLVLQSLKRLVVEEEETRVLASDIDIHLTGVAALDDSGMLISVEEGGTLENSGSLKFANCSANYAGGAICSEGTVILDNAEFSGNKSNANGGHEGLGGAIFNMGEAVLKGVTFKGNTAVGCGGAIYNDEDATLSIGGAIFNGNTAMQAGAIYNLGVLNITGSIMLMTANDSICSEGDSAVINWALDDTVALTRNTDFSISDFAKVTSNSYSITLNEDSASQMSGMFKLASNAANGITVDVWGMSGLDGAVTMEVASACRLVSQVSTDKKVYYELLLDESNDLCFTVDTALFLCDSWGDNETGIEVEFHDNTITGCTGDGTFYNNSADAAKQALNTNSTVVVYGIEQSAVTNVQSKYSLNGSVALSSERAWTNAGTAVRNAVVNWDLSGKNAEDGICINGFEYYHNTSTEIDEEDEYLVTQTITVTDDQDAGRYVLASGDLTDAAEDVTGKYDFTLVSLYDKTGTDLALNQVTEYNGRYYSFYVDDAGTADETDDELVLGVDSDAKITIKVDNTSVMYDGQNHKASYTVIGENLLLSGDTLEVTLSDTEGLTNAGSIDWIWVDSYTVMRGSEDVTGEYQFNDSIDGSLEVYKRDITVTTDSATKTYDGKALTCDGYTVTGSGFVEGEGATYKVTGSQTEVGTVDNTIDCQLNKGTDSNNYDISIDCGTLSVTEILPITITANSRIKTYDGTALTDAGYTVTGGQLAEGDILSVTVSGSITDAGTATNKITGYKIVRGGTTDVTDRYKINTQDGVLEVSKREVVLTSVTDEKMYDGTTLMNHDYTVTGDGFVAGEAEVVVTGAQKTAGTSKNTITVKAGTGYKESNYAITKDEGDLTVTPNDTLITITANSDSKTYDGTALTDVGYTYTGVLATGDYFESVTVDGSITDFGTAVSTVTGWVIKNEAGEDVTSSYSNIQTVDGTLAITKRSVTLTSASETKEYDSKALTNTTVTVTGDGFVEGEATAVATGTQTSVGTSKNTISVTKEAAYKDDNYTVITVEGDLTVTGWDQLVTITADSDSKTYDGTALTDTGSAVTGLAEGHTITVTTAGAITDFGTAVNKVASYTIFDAAGNDVTVAYSNVKTADGTLAITKRSVTLTSASETKEYDSTPLTNATVTVTGDGFVAGEATAVATGTQTSVGSSKNQISVTKEAAYKDDNYTVITVEGDLTVTGWDQLVTITADSDSKTYDGTALTDTGSKVTGLAEGHTITVATAGAITDFGTAENKVAAYTIFDAAGNDVTVAYSNVKTADGTLSITKRNVTLTSGDATKEYDGKPLTNATVTVTGDGFVEGEATAVATGSQTSVGSSKNTISVNAGTGYKESNYTITKVEGTLTVTGDNVPPTVTINADTTSLLTTVTFDAEATDNLGVTTFQYTTDAGETWVDYANKTPLTATANGTWTFKATDKAGNFTEKSVIFTNINEGGEAVEVAEGKTVEVTQPTETGTVELKGGTLDATKGGSIAADVLVASTGTNAFLGSTEGLGAVNVAEGAVLNLDFAQYDELNGRGALEAQGLVSVSETEKYDLGLKRIAEVYTTDSLENVAFAQDLDESISSLAFYTNKTVYKAGEDRKATTVKSGTDAAKAIGFGNATGTAKSDTITFGAGTDVTLGTVGKTIDLLEGTNVVKVEKKADATVASDLVNLAKLTAASGTKDEFTELAFGKVGMTEKGNSISLGNFTDTTFDTVGFGAGNDTLKVGNDSDFASKSLDFGAGSDKFTVGARTKAKVDGTITGVRTLTAASGKATTKKVAGEKVTTVAYTEFAAGDVTLESGLTDSVSFGNYTKSTLGKVAFGEKNDTFKVGNYAESAVTSLDFGDGKADALTVGAGSTLTVTDLDVESVDKLSLGKGATLYLGADSFADATARAETDTTWKKYVDAGQIAAIA